MWPLNTMGDPVPVVLAVACAAVMLLSWGLAKTLPKASITTRAIAITITICVIIIGLVALSVGIARAYPGPAGRYAQGTALHWVHQHALLPGSYLALLIPLCVAGLVAALRPEGGRRTTIIAVVLSALLIVPSLIIGLAVICNHAGACP